MKQKVAFGPITVYVFVFVLKVNLKTTTLSFNTSKIKLLSLHLLKYHVKWYVSFQHFSYSIWSFLQKHDNVHFKAPQEDKKPIYLTKEYGLCQQNWQEIRCHCGTVVCCAALWTKKSKKGRYFNHIQHYYTLEKKPSTYLSPNYHRQGVDSSQGNSWPFCRFAHP